MPADQNEFSFTVLFFFFKRQNVIINLIYRGGCIHAANNGMFLFLLFFVYR